MVHKLSINQWFMAFRPKTLTAALVPILAGTALVIASGGKVSWNLCLYALLASFFIQIGTNLVNDAADFKKGADTEERIGPRRVTQAGIFSSKTVMTVAGLFFLLAFACGVPLVFAGGWPILAIGLLSIFLGYSYTAGPFPLAYLGLGDLFVVLFFGVVALGGFFFLQTGQWAWPALLLGLQIGLHCAVLIAINNLRDIEQDRKANKKTLPVRFGKEFARIEITVLSLAPFFLAALWLPLGFKWSTALSLLVFPLAIKIIRFVRTTEPSPAYNRALGWSAGLHLAFGTLTALGLLL